MVCECVARAGGTNESISYQVPFLAKEHSMLVLSRRKGESIRIGDSISLTIVQVQGNRVQLAIDAPRSVPVHREEVYRRIENEQQTALVLACVADDAA